MDPQVDAIAAQEEDSTALDGLTNDLLLAIFAHVAEDFTYPKCLTNFNQASARFSWFRSTLPLVCKRWAAILAGPGPWQTIFLHVGRETEHQRAVASGTGILGSSPTSLSTSPILGSTIPLGPPGGLQRRSLSLTVVRSAAVLDWASRRARRCEALLVSFQSVNHDFTPRAFQRLLMLCKPSLKYFKLLEGPGVGSHQADAYECLGSLRQLEELSMEGLPQDFLSATLPYLSGLPKLRALHFKPDMGALSYAIKLSVLPPALERLELSHVWLEQLGGSGSSSSTSGGGAIAPAAVGPERSGSQLRTLRHADFQSCHLSLNVLSAVAAAPAMESMTLAKCTVHAQSAPHIQELPGAPAIPPDLGSALLAMPCALPSLSIVECGLRQQQPEAVGGGAFGAEGVWGAAQPRRQLQHHVGMSSLTKLDLSKNPELGLAGADTLPQLSALQSLTHLELSGCGLTVLPRPVWALPLLQYLGLHGNSLSSLPRDAPAFSGTLRCITLTNNRFVALPRGLLACGELRELSVGAAVAGAASPEAVALLEAFSKLQRLQVKGTSYDARTVNALLKLSRQVMLAGRQLDLEVI